MNRREFLPKRQTMLESLEKHQEIDVLVIGAGINGCATFRDIAIQNSLSVLLVDKEDFGAGASMASSRMAHGGLRYMENGEFRLTKEALTERDRLLKHAGIAVYPQVMAIPFFSWFAGVAPAIKKIFGLPAKYSERGFVLAEVGLHFYDFYTRHQRQAPSHRFMGSTSATQKFSGLHTAVKAVSTYFDGLIHSPERIALSLVSDGVKSNKSALALNHMACVGSKNNSEIYNSVALRDTLTQKQYFIKPKLIINATGAWIDNVGGTLQVSNQYIGGTKGSHLVLDNPDLLHALSGHGFVFDDGKGRMCITYPFEGKVILGATDIPITNPDEAECTDEEVDYLLKAIRVIFPGINVTHSHIRYRYAGVRPLPRSDSGITGEISRDHSLHKDKPNNHDYSVLSLVGGKWTTYRAFAQEATDKVLSHFSQIRTVSTAHQPVGKMFLDLPYSPSASEQEKRYGKYFSTFQDFCSDNGEPELSHSISRAEIEYLVRYEMALTLEDIVFRRTNIAVKGELTEPLVRWIAKELEALTKQNTDIQAFIDQHNL